MVRYSGRIVAGGMLRENTPIEDYQEEYGLWVKREDKSCLPPGPPFSKARGVYARVASRPEEVIGVLDTSHSQAGHAVAMACRVLGKSCLNFYPEFKHTPGPKEPQRRAEALGAELYGLPAGRSAILYHAAKKVAESIGGYMMPNALKLHESVAETAREVPDSPYDYVIIPASSGTIAAGVVKGFCALGRKPPTFILHLGYTRSHDEVRRYITEAAGVAGVDLVLIDEGYAYKDTSVPGDTPPWPCNPYYDLKAFRWWRRGGHPYRGRVLFWNIG